MATMLILRLEGVLQSWGSASRFDNRDSGRMPTKSGVIGLIACALGYARGDERIEKLSDSLQMGVRADRAGRMMVDYQTVTGERGYLFNAEGKKRVGEPTILTPRQYLEDACFTVALAGDVSLLHACADALKAPTWQIYLGRKSCVPVRPVYEELRDYPSMDEALEHYPLCERHDDVQGWRCEIEDPGGMLFRRDVIRESGRRYDIRRVRPPRASGKGV